MKEFRVSIALVAMLNLTVAYSQWNDFGGNNINSTEFLGADGLSTVPLLLKTIPDLSIDFSTSNALRARLWENKTNTINGFPGIVQNGFVGFSDQPLFFTSGVGPFSRLHLVDLADGNTTSGFFA